MQTVAAQWLMVSLTSSAVLVGAIQATNLPVLVLAVPAGVLGDLLDRKKLILAGRFVMLLAAAALGALDVAGAVTPAGLLILLCGVGIGQGLTGPIAQTLQPELVPAPERPQAIALGSVNQNLARSIGPAIGGALLAATSAALVFFVNAFSFVAVLVVVALVKIPPRISTLPREHFRSAWSMRRSSRRSLTGSRRRAWRSTPWRSRARPGPGPWRSGRSHRPRPWTPDSWCSPRACSSEPR